MKKDSRIYVAGHSGLFGSATVKLLEENGYTNLIVRSHSILDLTSQRETEDFFKRERPEYVIAMAGKVGGIKANAEQMADFTSENLKMSLNIIDASHKYGVKKLLYIGSSCMYPIDSVQPVKEEYMLQGALELTNEGYAIAKIAGVKLCNYHKKQYGDNFISCVPANVFGCGDNFDEANNHVIPALIKRFHQGKKAEQPYVEIWGSGKAEREFLYIEDAVKACVFMMENYDGVEMMNIGVGKRTSIKNLAYLVKDIVGYKGEIKFDTTKPDGMMIRGLDGSKIKEMGWQPQVSLEEGICKTYHWYLENEEKLHD